MVRRSILYNPNNPKEHFGNLGYMAWLKEHSFLATWLSPILAVLIAVWRTKGAPRVSEVDWTTLLGYVTFFVAFGVAISSSFDESARSIARTIAGLGFGAFFIGGVFRRR